MCWWAGSCECDVTSCWISFTTSQCVPSPVCVEWHRVGMGHVVTNTHHIITFTANLRACSASTGLLVCRYIYTQTETECIHVYCTYVVSP